MLVFVERQFVYPFLQCKSIDHIGWRGELSPLVRPTATSIPWSTSRFSLQSCQFCFFRLLLYNMLWFLRLWHVLRSVSIFCDRSSVQKHQFCWSADKFDHTLVCAVETVACLFLNYYIHHYFLVWFIEFTLSIHTLTMEIVRDCPCIHACILSEGIKTVSICLLSRAHYATYDDFIFEFSPMCENFICAMTAAVATKSSGLKCPIIKLDLIWFCKIISCKFMSILQVLIIFFVRRPCRRRRLAMGFSVRVRADVNAQQMKTFPL